jgi:hypothetical protein
MNSFGKIIIALIWVFWLMNIDNTAMGKEEYFPTYGSTFDRVKERGIVNCGTKADFPGFSESTWDTETEFGTIWFGFDVDICRAVAAAVLGDANAVEYIIVDGNTRFEYLIDGTIDMLSAATTYTFLVNVYVVAADNISIVPSIKYSNLVFPSTIIYSTAFASPSTAAATARQISTSNPNQIVPNSVSVSHVDSEKPGKSAFVPQLTIPLSFTLSNVLPYVGKYSSLPIAVLSIFINQNTQIKAIIILPKEFIFAS